MALVDDGDKHRLHDECDNRDHMTMIHDGDHMTMLIIIVINIYMTMIIISAIIWTGYPHRDYIYMTLMIVIVII